MPAFFAVLVSRLAADVPAAIGGGWSSSDRHTVIRILAAVGLVLFLQQLVAAVREVLRWDLYRRDEEYLVARVMRATVSAPDLDLFEDPALAQLTDRAVRIAQFEPGDLVDGLTTNWMARAPGLAAIAVVATVWPIAAVVVAVAWFVAGQQMQADSRRGDRETWTDAMRRATAIAARQLREQVGTVTVLVSHRFSTVRMADHIIVLDHGHIIEHGNHDQLISQHGLYTNLFELQARVPITRTHPDDPGCDAAARKRLLTGHQDHGPASCPQSIHHRHRASQPDGPLITHGGTSAGAVDHARHNRVVPGGSATGQRRPSLASSSMHD